MKEYRIGSDGFEVADANLLGGQPGQGFVQLMATSRARASRPPPGPSAWRRTRWTWRWTTRSPAASSASRSRAFRVANKLAMMAAEILGARRLAWAAARAKDEGQDPRPGWPS